MHLLNIVLTQVSLRSHPRLTWAETFSERLVNLYQNITGFHDLGKTAFENIVKKTMLVTFSNNVFYPVKTNFSFQVLSSSFYASKNCTWFDEKCKESKQAYIVALKRFNSDKTQENRYDLY